jgi:ribonucleoside-diphosphate reductase alpha chain
VVDASKFPLEAQAAEARAKRRIGLGVTGLADALLMVGLRYGSDEAVTQTEDWLHAIARAAYLASVDLAKEKGAFPLFERDAYLASGTMKAMDDDVRDAVATHGIRNAHLPDYFVNAQTLPPEDHVKLQAAAQKWVDSSISKTINCPEDISFEAFKSVYMQAWDLGCKGCTTYRPNDVTGSVLSVSERSDKMPGETPDQVRGDFPAEGG